MGKLPKYLLHLTVIWTLIGSAGAWAESNDQEAPWGRSHAVSRNYDAQKVVYDLRSGSESKIEGLLDRAAYLTELNDTDPFDTHVVIIIHGGAVPYFALSNHDKHKELMKRAYSLSLNEVVEFRMCGASARLQGFEPRDLHGFLTVVPMADAEIAKLQHEGYAYMY